MRGIVKGCEGVLKCSKHWVVPQEQAQCLSMEQVWVVPVQYSSPKHKVFPSKEKALDSVLQLSCAPFPK